VRGTLALSSHSASIDIERDRNAQAPEGDDESGANSYKFTSWLPQGDGKADET
jgi:hypothetical protein